MFKSNTEVRATQIRLGRQRADGSQEVSSVLNILSWEEEGKTMVHCIELDIAASGASQQEALHELAVLLTHQIEFAEQNKLEIWHPAPDEYWEKLREIQMNRLKQLHLSNPARFKREVERELAHA